jgi:hypothetical protein
LTQTWDGVNGAGSGFITAGLAGGRGSQDLLADWQSSCIPNSSESPSQDEPRAVILSVQIHQVDQNEQYEEAGFTVSFKQLGKPEILRFGTSPITISNNGSSPELESWRDPPPSTRLHAQNIAPPRPTGDSIEEALEAEIEEFQELQFRAHELQRLIAKKENNIRKFLQQDCSSISSQVGQCESFGCFFQTCFSAFPEIISRLKCRYGSLDSCLSRKPSLGCEASGDLGNTNAEQPLTDPHNYNTSHGMGTRPDPNYHPDDAVNTDSPYSTPSSPNGNTTYPDDYFQFSRGYFALFVVLILSYCLFRRCVRVCRSPRRRAEHAARREERRNRLAYRCAARRYRWSQWWRGGQSHNRESSSQDSSGYDLERAGNEASRRQSTSDASSIFEEGAMQAEILGLRRALEFVGELVRPEEVGYHNQQRRYPRQVFDRSGSPSTSARPAPVAPPASSTAMLTTISSPRTSSLMSCDTGSSVTLETLDQDPPEYQK